MSVVRTFIKEIASVPCPCGKGRIVKAEYEFFETETTWGNYYYEYSIDCEYCNQKYDINKYRECLKDKVSGEIIDLDIK